MFQVGERSRCCAKTIVSACSADWLLPVGAALLQLLCTNAMVNGLTNVLPQNVALSFEPGEASMSDTGERNCMDASASPHGGPCCNRFRHGTSYKL
jgi:hypothetical protein